MKLSWKWVIGAALAALVVVVIIGLVLVKPPQPLLLAASFAPAIISPNADGDDDITLIAYELSRDANISLTFESEDGVIFNYRRDQPRTAGEYSVLFSGVVDGYTNEGETVQGEVLRRLMPDGTYTWRLSAVGDDGELQELTGLLTLENGEGALPEIPEFTVFPQHFTPNQDGISDRTAINVGLSKSAELQVYLIRDGMEPIFIPERIEGLNPDLPALRHLYDYDGGVDLGADPPADGEYTLVALAQDAAGQQVQRTATITIQDGGKPQAQIVPQPSGATVIFEAAAYDDAYFTSADDRGELIPQPQNPEGLSANSITMRVGDMLVFQLTVENYSETPIRTHGSPPGTVYDWTQRASAFGEADESGAWRVGIDCDTAASDYPWRWRLGTDDDLMQVTDLLNEDIVYYYLPPGARAVVWGAVRMSEIEARNPQNCWAGLIHEDVGTTTMNINVGPRSILLVDPPGEQSDN
ncbi:MAG: hypothetical protein IAE89_04055 [Anaerolineae bacterium]|nr:hypothetical protein [Anaerolineae bacterium]